MKLPSLYPLVSSVQHPSVLGMGPLDCKGATVHYTADRDLDRVVREGLTTRIGYHLLISRDGLVVQTAYLDQRVNHAGTASWRTLSPNRYHMAVALVGLGMLQVDDDGALKGWEGTEVGIGEARQAGSLLLPEAELWWDAATPAQLKALREVLSWAVALGAFEPDAVAGHDEVALPPGRKIDPGGTLPGGMDAVRRSLSAS